MRFNFNLKQSKLYDFLKFPKCLFQEEHFMQVSALNNYKEVVNDSYFEMLTKFKEILAPYSKEIEIFYPKQFIDFDFIDLIMNAYPSRKDYGLKQYLESLLLYEEGELKEGLINSLIDHEELEQSKANFNYDSNEELVEFINLFSIEPNLKWNLILILQDPVKYVKKYVNLMNKIIPLFEKEYASYESKVLEYGFYVIDYINKFGYEGIEQLSNSLLNKSINLEHFETILISAFFPYSIIVYDNSNLKQIVWGISVENALKKIKEINENKLIERTQVFKLLGDKTKYEVLKYISQGITSTKEIASLTKVSSATISYHLNSFLTAKIIKLDNINKKFSYVIDYEVLDLILNDLKNDLKFPK